jgi:hypothetical protein
LPIELMAAGVFMVSTTSSWRRYSALCASPYHQWNVNKIWCLKRFNP